MPAKKKEKGTSNAPLTHKVYFLILILSEVSTVIYLIDIL